MKKVFILIFAIFFPLYSYAQQKIFYLDVGVEYNDNLYLTNTNKESDLITYVSPGIRWEKIFEKNYFSLYYAPTWTIYYSHTDRNTLRHDILTKGFHYFNPHIKLSLRNHYIKSEEPIEKIEKTISQIVRTTRNTYERDILNINLEWKYSKLNLAKIGYKYSFLENKDPTYEDSKESTIHLNLTHWFTIKHGINVDFKYKKNRVSKKTKEPSIPDFDSYDLDISYNYNLNKHTRIGFGYYITKRGFLERTITDRYVKMHSIIISHKISPFTSTYLELFKFRPYGIKGIDKDFTGYELRLKRKRQIRGKSIVLLKRSMLFYLKKSWDVGYLEARRRGFTRYTEVGLNFMKQLNSTTLFEHNFSYRRNHYYYLFPKKDKTYFFSVSLKKNIKPNLAIEMTYKHEERTSPVSYYNYKYNGIIIFFHYFFKCK